MGVIRPSDDELSQRRMSPKERCRSARTEVASFVYRVRLRVCIVLRDIVGRSGGAIRVIGVSAEA